MSDETMTETAPAADATAMTLTIPITRAELALWLAALPENQRALQAEQALAVGHQVLTFIHASASDEAMQRFFGPVVDKMGQLDRSLQTMLSGVQKSQRLGDIGERMVEGQLRAAFPNDQFGIISDTGHQADLRATFDLGAGQSREALVEVKLYTNDVPSAELEKFRADLREQRTRYGLMVSLNSRLTGIRAPYEIEATGDYLALYVPNAGADGVRLYWGAVMLKALMQFEVQSARQLRGDAVEQAWGRLQVELGQLEQAATEVAKLREGVQRVRGSLLKELDGLYQLVSAAEVRLLHVVDRVKVRLHEELTALPTAAPAPALPPPTPPDVLVAWMVALDAAKDKRSPLYRMVLDAAAQHHLDVALRDNELVLAKDSAAFAETVSTKGEVRLRFANRPGHPVTFLPGLEEWKSNAVELKVKDADVVAERVGLRVLP